MNGVPPKTSPKLAAILAIDVVGYTRLMRAAEAQTLADLKTLRGDVIDPTVTTYNGRLFKAMGDGFLLEFGSVANAVRCAIDIQQKMLARNASSDGGRILELRMGLNVADIIPDQDDVYGDGVNVAARLQALAEPSGICISGAVYEQIRSAFGDAFKRLGPKSLKNIDMPIEVYATRVGERTQAPFRDRLARFGRARRSIVVASTIGLFAAGVGLFVITEFGPPFPLDGDSVAAAAGSGARLTADAVNGNRAEVARQAASADAEVAKAKAEAEAEADTAAVEAAAKAQVVKKAVEAWKAASLSVTEAAEDLRKAEARLGELKATAGALENAEAEAAKGEGNGRRRDALAQRIRSAQEDLARIRARYEAAVKGEERARAHMERVKADAQSFGE